MDNFKRQVNESEEHFIWRVYKYRDDTGDFSNKNCGEICNRELKLDYNESRHRKIYESFLKIWQHVKDEYIDDKKISNRLNIVDDREEQLYKTKVKTRDKLREYRKHLRDEARIEELQEFITQVAQSLPIYNFDKDIPILKGDNSAILQISDWHMGKEIKNYWNEFNEEILEQRVNDLIKRTKFHCKKNNINELIVVNLSDMIDGNIHVSTRVSDNIDAVEQTMKVSELIANMLNEFANFGLKVKYVGVLDNHSRINKNYKEHIEKESFSKIIDWWIAERMKNNANFEIISNVIDDNIGNFQLNGKNFYCVHGHLDNPNKVIEDMSLSVGEKADYVLMGHYHSLQLNEKYFSKLIMSGSLCGIDEYAKDKRLFSNPSQNLIILQDNDDVIINMKFDPN